ncbi:helix-turn-helix transcriptional regulator, partial [Actinospica durhamensis]
MQLAKRTGYASSTLQEALGGRRLPTLPVAMAIIEACDADPVLWHRYWAYARRSLDPDVPTALGRAATPPWPAV